MAKEIERKFLVHEDDAWRQVEGTPYRQGYLNTAKERTVRVRTIGSRGYLTIKGEAKWATRSEFEYEIPVQEAQQMLEDLCIRPLIEKTRRKIEWDGLTWEVDEFLGANKGLILAEVELESEDQSFTRPAWVGSEVTTEPRYYNANLVNKPYAQWPENQK